MIVNVAKVLHTPDNAQRAVGANAFVRNVIFYKPIAGKLFLRFGAHINVLHLVVGKVGISLVVNDSVEKFQVQLKPIFCYLHVNVNHLLLLLQILLY